MGRLKKPIALKKQEGTFRSDRDGNKLELPSSMPILPNYISEAAKKYYLATASKLYQMNLINDVDETALVLLAEAYDDYRKAKDYIDEHGDTYSVTNQAGEILYKMHPKARIMSESWLRVKKMLSEFGLTPSARAKLNAVEDQVITLDDLLND
tara:strand:- start:1530 stop:1988 length:459 start_codon:yes stop_codon:yes gene_type:complete